MKVFIKIIRICQYQLRILSRNYKIFTIPVCMTIFMWNALNPFRDFLISVNEKATPFLFPFLFSNKYLAALMFAGVVLFFIDAPFYDKHQLFVVMRSGKEKWILGQALYIVSVSVLYMIFLVIMSVIMLIPHIMFGKDWGRIWTTLAVTDATYDMGTPFNVSGKILFKYSPIQAIMIVFGLGILICAFYGFFMWCLNLFFGKIISLSVTLASIILVIRIQYFPAWVMYVVPSAWADLSVLSEYAFHKISIFRAAIILILAILCLGIISFYKTLHSDIARGEN